ncbi:MAG: hypothetical protein Q4A28_05450 [Brachymonas sp.]|nr:hypothetical protein [Brachymonas sp.]
MNRTKPFKGNEKWGAMMGCQAHIAMHGDVHGPCGMGQWMTRLAMPQTARLRHSSAREEILNGLRGDF